MVAPSTDQIDPLSDEAVYERRRRIAHALQYELKLEKDRLASKEAEVEAQEKIVSDLQSEITDYEFNVGVLEDAVDNVVNSLGHEQIAELNKELMELE